MGMCDTVHISCPKCNEVDEVQTKAGDCLLQEYDLDDAPPEILASLARRDPFTCLKCGTQYKVKVQIISHAKAVIYKPDNEEDE